MLGVLVFFHELGHYLAARWRGVHVEVFSIGFGRALVVLDRALRHALEDRLAAAGRLREAARAGAAAGRVGGGACQPGSPGRPSMKNRCCRARSSSPPGRSRISCWRRCVFAPAVRHGRPAADPAGGRRGAAGQRRRAGRAAAPATGSTASPATPIHDFRGHPADRRRPRRRQARRSTIERNGKQQQLAVTPQPRDVNGHEGRPAGHPRQQGRISARLALPAALWGGVTQTWHITAETVSGVAQMITGQRGTAGPGRAAAHRANCPARWRNWAWPACCRSSRCCR